jgi:hypothetical protein
VVGARPHVVRVPDRELRGAGRRPGPRPAPSRGRRARGSPRPGCRSPRPWRP